MAPTGLLTKKDNAPVPLRAVKVQATVRGYAAHVDCSLEYENVETQPIEAVFTFPLDSSSAVVAFTATVDGRKIKGKVLEKQQARETYDDAIASGQSAFLMESERRDIFTVSVGNLPPNTKATVMLTLVMELHTEHDGTVKFNLPTVLTPRYSGPGEQNPTENVSYLPACDIPYTFNFDMRIDADVDKVESSTHKLQTGTSVDDKGFQVTIVTLAEEHMFDKDLVLTITPCNPHKPHAIVETGSTSADKPPFLTNPAVSLNYFPDFSSAEAVSELIFVIDRSGSMSGGSISAAKDTLMLFLKSIPDGCYFNIVGFGSSYEFLFPDSVPYNQTHLDKASQHTEGIWANMGGTELLQPLQKIFSMPAKEGLPKQVFVLTDGAVSSTNAVIGEVKMRVHVARCFAVGIGSGASTELVKGIADSGHGSSEFVQNGERMQPKVMRMLKKALSPSVSDVHVSWCVPDGAHVIQTPNKVPPVFSGDRLVIYGLVTKMSSLGGPCCSATLKGVISGNPFQHTVSFSLDSSHPSSPSGSMAVHQLATKSVIHDLQCEVTSKEEQKKITESSVKPGEKAPESKEKLVVQLSIAASVGCDQTAFVAVDEASEKPVGGSMEIRHVPVGLGGFGLELSSMAKYARSMPSSMASMCSMPGSNARSMPRRPGASLGPPISSVSCSITTRAIPPSPPVVDALPQLCFQSRSRRHGSDIGMPTVSASGSIDSVLLESAPLPSPLPSQSRGSRPWYQSAILRSRSSGTAVPPSMLAAIVSQQKASGAWTLSRETARLVNKSMMDLEMSPPFPMPLSETQSSIWATAVVIAWLELNCADFIDEWELLADKAMRWLETQKQVLPQGVTTENLLAAARKLF